MRGRMVDSTDAYAMLNLHPGLGLRLELGNWRGFQSSVCI